jgi:hypothetical protein
MFCKTQNNLGEQRENTKKHVKCRNQNVKILKTDLNAIAESRQNPYVLCATLLVAFLHTRHRVSFRAYSLILIALGLIFSTLPGITLGGDKLPRHLRMVFSRLDLTDRFKSHPVCYICHKIFDPSIDSNTLCPDCECEIFRPRTRSLFRRLFQSVLEPTVAGDSDSETESARSGSGRRPHVVAPIQVLSEGLRHLFSRPGMVSAVTSWKARQRSPDELRSIQNEKVWNTIKGPDNKQFFFEGDSEKEIRLGVTFSLDWYVSRL